MFPDYRSLLRPVLECAKGEPRNISDVVDEISDQPSLTEEERQQLRPSGKQSTIANRIHWAGSYMKRAGWVRNIKRGWFELTESVDLFKTSPQLCLIPDTLSRRRHREDAGVIRQAWFFACRAFQREGGDAFRRRWRNTCSFSKCRCENECRMSAVRRGVLALLCMHCVGSLLCRWDGWRLGFVTTAI